MMRSNALRSTTRSLRTGNARARHGSIHSSAPSGKCRMWSCHAVGARAGPWGGVHRLELERLRMQHGRLSGAGVFPRRDIAEAGVVALRLAFGRLVFLAEVAAARLLAPERIVAHQLRELEEIRDAARVLEH